MKRRILAFAAVMTALATNAQETKPVATSAPAAAKTTTETASPWAGDWLQSAKKPASWIKFSGDIRLRYEYVLNETTLNATDKNHELSYMRFRGRFGATITAVTNLDLNIRLAAEPREWINGRNASGWNHVNGNGWDWTEGLIDQLNVSYKDAFELPMSITVGRQDIAMGDPTSPWLVADGTPVDGSRTAYFDAARVVYNVEDIHTKFDGVFINQYAENDKWLPVMNGLDKFQTEQDERGAILYVSNTSMKKMQVDGFFMYKHDEKVAPAGDNADLYTTGGRLAGKLDKNWSYNTEGAFQLGNRNFQDVSAFGVNSRIMYSLNDKRNNRFRLSYEYESGDDPNSKSYEQMDILWGRYPRWTESGIFYSKTETGRPGDVSNYHRMGPGWSISPCKKTDLRLDYYYLLADQNTASVSQPKLFSKDGNTRGHMVTSCLKYIYNQHFSGYVLGEVLFPGDYYVANDTEMFLRAELMYTW